MFQVTESASEAVKGIMAERKLDSPLRVTMSGGCCGPSLGLVVDEAKESDLKYEFDGVTYLVDKDLSSETGEIRLDYVDMGGQKGFTLRSQNPVGGGGCGSGCSC